MTRRIAITILLTVLACIVSCGTAAWVIARAILLANLDASIRSRATALLAASAGRGHGTPVGPVQAGDRFIIQDGLGQTLARPLPTVGSAGPEPKVIDAALVWLPDGPYRCVKFSLGDAAGRDVRAPATIVYSIPATELVRVLQRLAVALIVCGVAPAAIAALISMKLARLALRPLNDAAAAIGTVDETNLGRRVDPEGLPAELRPLGRQLNGMLERLQTAFEQRRRFVADASHELRTPTAAMITTMEVALRRPRTNAELEDVLRTCLDEARHLRQLVQSLLRQVRAELKSSAEEVAEFDASELVRQCTALAQCLADERKVRLIEHASGIMPVRAEPMRLRSILMNLISNAIEYNHAGGSVDVSCGSAGPMAEIRVRDDGPGIAASDLPHLFQPFYRASRTRASDGHLGLGLFLVDSHVKAMGGECRVESSPGAGTTFIVRLPLAGPPESSSAALPGTQWAGAASAMTEWKP